MHPTTDPTSASDPPPRTARPALLAIAASLLALFGSTACGLLDPDTGKVPDEARVAIGGNSSEELELVISDDFRRNPDQPGSQLLTSDTSFVLPAFEEAYTFGERRRFLVRLANPDSGDVDVTLRVFFDEELRYERASDLTDESLEFNFIFR